MSLRRFFAKPLVLKLIYWLCLPFIISGAFNYGVTRFAMAVPFMILAVVVAATTFKRNSYILGTVTLCILSIVCNMTLERNSFVFPILDSGVATVLNDGYQQTFFDGSGGFSKNNEDNCAGCGDVKFTELRKGETYKVTGINIGHPDFSTSISVVTPIGEFPESDFKFQSYMPDYERSISLNKPAERVFIKSLGNLMYYPVAIMSVPILIKPLLPRMYVRVIGDDGNVRDGKLSAIVTADRDVIRGDYVRLNCTKAVVLQNGRKSCELQFTGFPKARVKDDNPSYGSVPSFSVPLDSTGQPDSGLLSYE